MSKYWKYKIIEGRKLTRLQLANAVYDNLKQPPMGDIRLTNHQIDDIVRSFDDPWLEKSVSRIRSRMREMRKGNDLKVKCLKYARKWAKAEEQLRSIPKRHSKKRQAAQEECDKAFKLVKEATLSLEELVSRFRAICED
jgi:hypothetical protein